MQSKAESEGSDIGIVEPAGPQDPGPWPADGKCGLGPPCLWGHQGELRSWPHTGESRASLGPESGSARVSQAREDNKAWFCPDLLNCLCGTGGCRLSLCDDEGDKLA